MKLHAETLDDGRFLGVTFFGQVNHGLDAGCLVGVVVPCGLRAPVVVRSDASEVVNADARRSVFFNIRVGVALDRTGGGRHGQRDSQQYRGRNRSRTILLMRMIHPVLRQIFDSDAGRRRSTGAREPSRSVPNESRQISARLTAESAPIEVGGCPLRIRSGNDAAAMTLGVDVFNLLNPIDADRSAVPGPPWMPWW